VQIFFAPILLVESTSRDVSSTPQNLVGNKHEAGISLGSGKEWFYDRTVWGKVLNQIFTTTVLYP